MGNKPLQTPHCNLTDKLPPDVPEQSKWMAGLDDRTPFTTLSIPGTHCSCSAALTYTSWRHQNLEIGDALKAGIRYFDVPMRLQEESKLMLWQDSYPIGKHFDFLLAPLVYFLSLNKLGVIIVCLTEAYASEDSKQKFSDVVYAEIQNGVPSENIWTDRQLPETLGEARGKIIFLRNYSDGEARLVSFLNSVHSNQIGQTTNCETFWRKTMEDLINAKDEKDHKLYITYLSHKDLYYSAAYTINEKLLNFLTKNNAQKGRWGVIAMDFPGSHLIMMIIQANSKKMKAIEWQKSLEQFEK